MPDQASPDHHVIYRNAVECAIEFQRSCCSGERSPTRFFIDFLRCFPGELGLVFNVGDTGLQRAMREPCGNMVSGNHLVRALH